MGEKATLAHREFQEVDKRRDRVLFSMPTFREGEDLEEYFSTAERKMVAAKLPRGDWLTMLDARFTGRVAVAWRDLSAEGIEFEEAKSRLLKSCGYTPRVAADTYYGFRSENCRGLTADQLYSRGQQLLRRIVAPAKMTGDVEFALLKGWVYSVIPRKARSALDSRSITEAGSLVSALQDFLALEGEKGEGQTATFRKSYVDSKERSAGVTCFKCGRVGHRAADCWGPKGGGSSKGYVSGVVPGNVDSSGSSSVAKIVCFTCGIEGHKSPQCPSKGDRGKDAKAKPVKRVWRSQEGCVQLDGEVNGHSTSILIDSGASVSVVPETMVSPENLLGESVAVKAFGSQKAIKLPVASVPFKVGELEWVERVAVAPIQEGVECEV